MLGVEALLDPRDQARRHDALRDALVHLLFTYRSALLLHDVEGWTAAEVAEVHGTGLLLAKRRIRRGRMALVSQLARGDERRAVLEGVTLRRWDARSLVSDYLDDAAGERQQRRRHVADERFEPLTVETGRRPGVVGQRAATDLWHVLTPSTW
jgi:hypothetical protein